MKNVTRMLATLTLLVLALAFSGAALCQGTQNQPAKTTPPPRPPKAIVAPKPERPRSDSPGSFSVRPSTGTASGQHAQSPAPMPRLPKGNKRSTPLNKVTKKKPNH